MPQIGYMINIIDPEVEIVEYSSTRGSPSSSNSTQRSYEFQYTDESAEDENDDEDLSEDRFARDVTVSDSRHGDNSEVGAVPVCQVLRVGVVCPRITAQFSLTTTSISLSPVTKCINLVYLKSVWSDLSFHLIRTKACTTNAWNKRKKLMKNKTQT